MAKQELNWININASSLTGDMLKAWNEMNKAREAFKAVIKANAVKAKALNATDDLIINVKPWGFGMAKGTGKAQRTHVNGNMFAELT